MPDLPLQAIRYGVEAASTAPFGRDFELAVIAEPAPGERGGHRSRGQLATHFPKLAANRTFCGDGLTIVDLYQ